MSELTQRLRDGKEADRELDDEIALRFGWVPKQAFDGEWYWTDPSGKGCGETSPAFTSDLNAVFALVEREIWASWRVGNLPSGNYFAQLGTKPIETEAPSPQRALLLALLAAKEPRP